MLQSLEVRLPVTNTYVCTGHASDSRDLINSLLRQSGKENLPDCIFCSSSMTAHGVLRALWENQIPVPETVKIVAVGNGLDEDDLCTIPSLSVVQIQMEKVAAECMKLLLSLISDGASEPITRVIPVSYVPRESCGPLCRAF